MVFGFLAPNKRHNIVKDLRTSCGALSVNTNFGIPLGSIQLSRNIFAKCVHVMLPVAVAWGF